MPKEPDADHIERQALHRVLDQLLDAWGKQNGFGVVELVVKRGGVVFVNPQRSLNREQLTSFNP